MQDRLAIVIVETEEGPGIQFLDPDEALESFGSLVKLEDGKEGRATLVSIDYKADKATVQAKKLPVEEISKDEQPDGIVLGQGPVWLPKKEEKEDGGRKEADGDSKDG